MPTSNDKGNVAEAEVVAAATRLGIPVLRPTAEHTRYDLVFDLPGGLTRVQCKWAPRKGEVVVVRWHSTRRGRTGYIRSNYTAEEIDAVAAYCPGTDACYFIPVAAVGDRTAIQLRLSPPANGQRAAVHFAADYELGAVAQLGERRHGMAEVRGSIPLSSTSDPPATLAAYDYRQKFGWYMERAAAGETFLITRRGKPYARLSPPHLQLDLAPEPAEVVPITTAKENR